MSGSASVWIFAILAIVLVGACSASLYWAGRRSQRGASHGQAWLLALIVPLAVAGLYALYGTPRALNPPPPDAPMHDAAAMNAAVQSLADRLQQHPEDLDGWLMLARSYMTMGRYAEAEAAFGHAQAKVMQNDDLLVTWIELRIMLGGRKFDARSLELLDQATKLAPDSIDVLLLGALAAYDRGDKTRSDALVAKLHERFAPGTPARKYLAAALEKWMTRDATDQPPTLAASPSPAASASAPVPDVNTMVQRLADRLKDHPEDLDGWLMLARSYAVLGRYAEADAAYQRAQDKAMQDSSQLATWIEMRLRLNGLKFDARSQELLDRAVSLAPDNPDVLLLRALSAFGRGDKAGGDALVAKLRERLAPGTPERESLDAALRQLMPPDAAAKP